MKKNILLIVAMMLMGGYAHAVTDNLGVSASVAMDITLNVTQDVAFGPYSGVQLDAAGAISLTRSVDSLPVNITLSMGAAPDFTPRMMGAALEYNLFTDIGRTIIWGDGTDSSVVVSWLAGTGLTTTYTIYGRILGAQSPPSTNYTDAIIVTAEY